MPERPETFRRPTQRLLLANLCATRLMQHCLHTKCGGRGCSPSCCVFTSPVPHCCASGACANVAKSGRPARCRIREIIPPAAWHSLQPAAMRDAAVAVARGETDAGPAADLPHYVRSRLRLLMAEGLEKPVNCHGMADLAC